MKGLNKVVGSIFDQARNVNGSKSPLATSPTELFTTLLQTPEVRIERIVSHGHQSPDGFWYDQPTGEWVIVLKGAARIELEGKTVEMKPGDYLEIPARTKHRVVWTIPDEPTIWLAVRYDVRG